MKYRIVANCPECGCPLVDGRCPVEVRQGRVINLVFLMFVVALVVWVVVR